MNGTYPTFDLHVRGGLVVSEAGARRADVFIRDGRFELIGEAPVGARSSKVIDATGLVVLPGIIDGHVHLRDPGFPAKEDFYSGTSAAAAGGITTVVDMPNTSPPTVDGSTLNAKGDRVEALAIIDVALTGLVAGGGASRLAELLDTGAVGLNVFGGARISDLPWPSHTETEVLIRDLNRPDVPVGFLAEDYEVVDRRRAELEAAGERVGSWVDARVAEAELSQARRLTALAIRTGAHVHVNHLSTARAMAEIVRGREAGARITCETSPHYLFRTRADLAGSRLVAISPPLRTRVDSEVLERGASEGDVDIVCSDHAPHLASELDRPDLWNPPVTGFSGVELLVPLLLDAVTRGRFRLNDVARFAAAAPADLFGLAPQKGRIVVGADADLTIADLNERRVVDPGSFRSRGRLTPFAGTTLAGWPTHTIVRGTIVFENDKVVGRPGWGQWIRRGRHA
jgi:dihydroorotase